MPHGFWGFDGRHGGGTRTTRVPPDKQRHDSCRTGAGQISAEHPPRQRQDCLVSGEDRRILCALAMEPLVRLGARDDLPELGSAGDVDRHQEVDRSLVADQDVTEQNRGGLDRPVGGARALVRDRARYREAADTCDGTVGCVRVPAACDVQRYLAAGSLE